MLKYFQRTGCAIGLAGARDETGKLLDDYIALEGMSTTQMRDYRAKLLEPPAPLPTKTPKEILEV